MSEDAQEKIIEICTSMIDGEINLIEGCRKLVSLRHRTGEPENEIFSPLRAVDSETDHFPIGGMREYCSKEYLEVSDREVADYLDEVQPQIIEACKRIVDFYSDG
ncbi:hypothetical protein CK501_16490 [Halovibrio salipaludis]|uniref:DUF2489 domain-containing protein n=1 Tax=Halovibrio salipaludis TaxID=2032626 RepID=A0A2A2ETR9_9GAMM|nr:DUF2489 domain-containing protein [Halovibrio salipaludis]PAU75815.1 hypothetical protein CK501_16490 [Halovibrio salipaludis]